MFVQKFQAIVSRNFLYKRRACSIVCFVTEPFLFPLSASFLYPIILFLGRCKVKISYPIVFNLSTIIFKKFAWLSAPSISIVEHSLGIHNMIGILRTEHIHLSLSPFRGILNSQLWYTYIG